MTQEHRMTSMTDILKLDEDQFKRFVPDLVAWWYFAHDLGEVGAHVTAMVWVDDGKPGEIHSLDVTIRETSEKYTIPGPAWEKR